MRNFICNAVVCSALFFVHCGGIQGQDGQNGGSGTSGATGPQGPQGEPGLPGTVPANVNLVTPSVGYPGRSLQLALSSVATMFTTSAPTIDFGDAGISVTKTAVANDDSLLVSITIAPTAKFGPHTVTVTAGGQSLKLSGGFTVLPELVAEPVMVAPTALQGGVAVFNLRNQDYVTNPFANMQGTEVLSGPGLFEPVGGLGYYGVDFTGNTPSRIGSGQLVDPLATPGPITLSVQGHDAFGKPIGYYADPADPSLPQVKARTPTALTLGTAVTGQLFSNPGTTNLYSFNNDAANNVLFAQYTNLGTCLTSYPQIVGQTAPASGKFKDGQPFGSVIYTKAGVANQVTFTVLGAAGTTYASTFRSDFYGAATCNYDANFRTIPSVAFSAAEPMMPDTATKPLAALTLTKSSALVATDASIDVDNDTDYFQYTVSAPGDVFILVTPKSQDIFASSVQVRVFSDSKCSVQANPELSFSRDGYLLHDTATAGALTRCIAIQGFIGKNPYRIAFANQ